MHAVDDEVTLMHGLACVTETPTKCWGFAKKIGLDYLIMCVYVVFQCGSLMMKMLKMMKNVRHGCDRLRDGSTWMISGVRP